MGEGEGGEALSLFRFHLSPFPPETPDTQVTRMVLHAWHAPGITCLMHPARTLISSIV